MKYWAVMILGVKLNPNGFNGVKGHLTATGGTKEHAIKAIHDSIDKHREEGYAYVFELNEISKETYGFIVTANNNDDLGFVFTENSYGNT